MESLLKLNIAYYTGTCDRAGHPVIATPRSGHDALLSTSVDDVANLLRRYINVAPVQQKINGFTVVADFSSATLPVAEKLVAVLSLLQSENRKAVYSLLMIKPNSWKRRRQLAKLTGYRDAKKGRPPKTPFQIFTVKDVKGLQVHVDRAALPEELGGTVHIKKDIWIQFYSLLDSTLDACEKCLAAADNAERQAREASQLPIPSMAAEIAELEAKIDKSSASAFEQLQLDAAAEGCSNILSKIQPLDDNGVPRSPRTTAAVAASSALMRMFHADMIREVARRIKLQQNSVIALRERLQVSWRQAKARLVQALQLLEHRREARKICKWVSSIALPRLEQLAAVPESIQEMETLSLLVDDEFKDCVKTDVMEPADRIYADVECMAMQDSAELRQSQMFIKQLRDSILRLQEAIAVAERTLKVGPALLKSIDQLFSTARVIADRLPAPPLPPPAGVNDNRNDSESSGSLLWLQSCAASLKSQVFELPSKGELRQVLNNLQYLRSESKRQLAFDLLQGVSMVVNIGSGSMKHVDGNELAAWCADMRRRREEGCAPSEQEAEITETIISREYSSDCEPADTAVDTHPLKGKSSTVCGTETTTATYRAPPVDELSPHLDTLEDHPSLQAEPDFILMLPAGSDDLKSIVNDFTSQPVQKLAETTGVAATDNIINAINEETISVTERVEGLEGSPVIESSYSSLTTINEDALDEEAAALSGALSDSDSNPSPGSERPEISDNRIAAAVAQASTHMHLQVVEQLQLPPASDSHTPKLTSDLKTEPDALWQADDSKLFCHADYPPAARFLAASIADPLPARDPAGSMCKIDVRCANAGAEEVLVDSVVEQPQAATRPTVETWDGSRTAASSPELPRVSTACEAHSRDASPVSPWRRQRCYKQVLDDIEHDRHLTPEQKLAQMVELIENVNLDGGSDESYCDSFAASLLRDREEGHNGEQQPVVAYSSIAVHCEASPSSSSGSRHSRDGGAAHLVNSLGELGHYRDLADSAGLRAQSNNRPQARSNKYESALSHTHVARDSSEHRTHDYGRRDSSWTTSLSPNTEYAAVLETIRRAELALQD